MFIPSQKRADSPKRTAAGPCPWIGTEDAPEPSSILAFWAKVAQGHSVPQGMDHAGLLLVMMGRQWADLGKASMEKLIGPVFRQVSRIQSKNELGVYRRRKKEPESLCFSWCARFAFPGYVL